MKCYLINHSCIYNEDRNELKMADNSCIVKMTSMRCRCLSYIISHAENGIIEKEELATELWGSRGQFVSDANLTQILYLIRRDLKSLGITDLFVTVPRQGIKVNDNISIESMAENKRPTLHITRWQVLFVVMLAMTLLSLLCSVIEITLF
ncbi:hypothetical protein MUA03_05095 [Enterobacteriaceae bacterium H16N7]|nr:hypothetical protein [Dryocola clanedunensis]